MQSWDYLVFVPLALAIGYLWRRSRKKNASCGACSSCPAGGCAPADPVRAKKKAL